MVPPADLAAVLRHPPQLDVLLASYSEAAVVDALRREGIAPYVAWLRPDVGALADDRRRAVLDAAVRHTEVVRVCDALVHAAVTPLIFKGGHGRTPSTPNRGAGRTSIWTCSSRPRPGTTRGGRWSDSGTAVRNVSPARW